MGSKDDATVLDYALRQGRIVVTSDTDFGELLAKSGARSPSVIIFVGHQEVRRPERLKRLLDVLSTYAAELRSGAILAIEAGRVRVRLLPIR